MRITILNGDMPGKVSFFTENISNLADRLRINYEVELFNFSQMDLKYCTGCGSCWHRTPGRCVIKDDAEVILRSVINADFYIFASPIIAGFTSSLLKKVTDRMIILIHPYLQIINGEHHHRKRYERYPDFGVIVQREPDTDDEDINILKDIYDRLAINLHARNNFVKVIENQIIKDTIHETCDL